MDLINRIAAFQPNPEAFFDGQYSQDIPAESIREVFFTDLNNQLSQPYYLTIAKPDGVLLSRKLGWDTDYFGFPVHKLEQIWAKNKPTALLLIQEYLEKLRTEKFYYTFTRVPATATLEQNALTQAGFELMLHKAMLRLELKENSTLNASKSNPDLTIRSARPEDQEFVTELAALSSMTSRFTLDEKIDQQLAAGIYRNWAENLLKGDPGSVLVAEFQGQQAGMVALADANNLYGPNRFPEYPMGFISLVAVSDKFREKAIGQALIAAAKQAFVARRYKVVFANTALQNKASLNMFQRAGFQVFSMVSEYRYWL
jgi:ribosomal protein S18 acetylase RimI-like enzyme